MHRTKIFVSCLLIVVGSSTTSAVLSACDKANDTEVLICSVDTTVGDSCRASIEKRNKTLEEFCSIVGDSLPLSADNKEHFDFSVAAYKKSFKNSHHLLTGANVSLVAKNKEAQAFVMWFHVGKYDRCRYIDITNVKNVQLQGSLTMLYDCMYFEPKETEIPFTLTVTEIPSRLQRTLTCTVPDYKNLNPVTIVEWKSMICVELFYDEKVGAMVWFQRSSHEFEKGNVSYNIRLYRDGSVIENLTLFAAEQFESSAKLEFLNLLPGNYSVVLRPVHPNCSAGCLTTTSWPFRVLEEGSPGPELSSFHIVLIVVGAASLVVLLLLGLKFARFKMPVGGASVFPIYVFDRPSHSNLMKQFATLLKALDLEVRFDAWQVQGHDPAVWVRQGVARADFIMIVWSDKAIKRYNRTITDDEVHDEPKYLTSHLFRGNLDCVSNRLNNSCCADNPHSHSSVCNICWDNSMKQQIPDEFKLMPTFVMPKHFPRLMSYLRGMPPNLPCEPFLHRENFKKCDEYTTFLKLLNHYKSELSSGKEFTQDHTTDFETSGDFKPSQLLVDMDNVALEAPHPNDSLLDLGYDSLSTENTNPPSIEVVDESRRALACVDDTASLLDQAFVNDILA